LSRTEIDLRMYRNRSCTECVRMYRNGPLSKKLCTEIVCTESVLYRYGSTPAKERQSDAVKSSAIVQVTVTECLSMESVLMVIIAVKSIH